ncbi:MAG: hypothetical protein EAZ31_10615 [Cytophagia bacterium]|nr:MAG: hypothetical protein EAY69_11540 [Cytophagales bacterium]TAG38322.1 MAG: hypothetical protein EAZ31_10615 [Cytophagia bacterium]
MIAEVTNIEAEIQALIEKKDIIFHQWAILVKSTQHENDSETDEIKLRNEKINNLMQEQANVTKRIMELYREIDAMDEL